MLHNPVLSKNYEMFFLRALARISDFFARFAGFVADILGRKRQRSGNSPSVLMPTSITHKRLLQISRDTILSNLCCTSINIACASILVYSVRKRNVNVSGHRNCNRRLYGAAVVIMFDKVFCT